MRTVRFALFTFLAACGTSTAWAQYGLYGSPETLSVPQPAAAGDPALRGAGQLPDYRGRRPNPWPSRRRPRRTIRRRRPAYYPAPAAVSLSASTASRRIAIRRSRRPCTSRTSRPRSISIQLGLRCERPPLSRRRSNRCRCRRRCPPQPAWLFAPAAPRAARLGHDESDARRTGLRRLLRRRLRLRRRRLSRRRGPLRAVRLRTGATATTALAARATTVARGTAPSPRWSWAAATPAACGPALSTATRKSSWPIPRSTCPGSGAAKSGLAIASAAAARPMPWKERFGPPRRCPAVRPPTCPPATTAL